jgi:threonine dehydratase
VASTLPTRDEIAAAAALIGRHFAPTPAYQWPILAAETGVHLVVKHENHTPTGAFKVRGGLVYLDRMARERPHVRGVVSATRGNHGQSIAYAARQVGVQAVIVVPFGNSVEKNAAMRAFGAELIEAGDDFDAARIEAARIAQDRGFEMVPSFDRDLVTGVATYGVELFTAHPNLAAVYVPIGLGSGMCGLLAAKAATGVATQVIGVVSDQADAYQQSFAAKRVVTTPSARTFADGMAVRGPSEEALGHMLQGTARVVTVSDAAVAEAIRLYWRATHNAAEGAGAAPLAALMAERAAFAGQKVGVILCGGNIDADWFADILQGGTPTPR